MNKVSLTVIPSEDPSRKEFGFSRTICACRSCTINCEHMPGYLIPSDLDRIGKAIFPEDIRIWAVSNLVASPGAVIGVGKFIVEVPTLTPAKHENGWCKFLYKLDDDGYEKRCKIHEYSPFGCAHFDHTTRGVATENRNLEGLLSIIEDAENEGPYFRIWQALFILGLVGQPPEAGRAAIRKAHMEEGVP